MGDSFFTLFFISNILLSIIFGIILFIKKFGKSQITVRAQYSISVLSLFILLIPFLPFKLFHVDSLFSWIKTSPSRLSGYAGSESTAQAASNNTNWLQDFSLTINESPFQIFDSIFFIIWVIGISVMLFALFYSNRKIHYIKKELQQVNNKALSAIFEECKQEIRFNKNVTLGYSSLIHSPLTFGLVRPYIVLPKHSSSLSSDELKCILLHELFHCKHRDMLVNYFICLLKAVYWFNPLVWYFLKEVKIEMEIHCDYSVLKSLDNQTQYKYGEVILKFASLPQQSSSLLAASEMSSSYKQIKKRIVNIVNFKAESQILKLKSALIFILVLAIIVMSIPSLSVLAINKEHHAFTKTNVIYKDYTNLFGEFTGGVVLYDSNKDTYTIHNKAESTTRFTPNSTYKIYSALLALETGVIARDDTKLQWDGTPYQYEEWNQDQDLFTAMERSTSWYFQTLDKQVGKKKVYSFLDKLDYGNENFTSSVTNFWLDGTLKISPVEQVDLLRKFYHNTFNFNENNLQTVKDSITLDKANGDVLSGKTGTSIVNGEHIDGWFIGYVETSDNTYFFAVHIKGNKQAGGSSATNIALTLLKQEGIYQSSY